MRIKNIDYTVYKQYGTNENSRKTVQLMNLKMPQMK